MARVRRGDPRPTRDAYDLGYEQGFDAGFRAGRREIPIAERTAFIREHKRPKKRKTKYQIAYSAAYKRLKKKHPRAAFGSLAKKAHAAARKKVK